MGLNGVVVVRSTIKDECATVKYYIFGYKDAQSNRMCYKDTQSNRMCYKEKHNLTECAIKIHNLRKCLLLVKVLNV